ncbi:DUF5915 domain-containing protein, partial [Sphaerisporangium sp. NPDC088356]|uniref:DUF5915 domain-containing protein n=1 Tax=Sphaerisporangium sp. NPDC088356 TaxID=3154871 RepID=UPI0034360C86
TKDVAAAITAADPAALAAQVRAGRTATVVVGGSEVDLGPDELIVTEQPRAGWAVETGAVGTGTGETVALDLTVTPELMRAGLIREVVRLVQDARKSSGLSITDRISLWWSASGDLAEALRADGQRVADEVLATTMTEGSPAADLHEHRDEDLGLTFHLTRAEA